MDQILDAVKMLPMREVAEAFGYEYDKKSSSLAWCVMRKDGDEVLCQKAANRFVSRDQTRKGTTIDFIQSQLVGDLGDVRRWYKSRHSAVATARRDYKPTPSGQIDRKGVADTLSMMDGLKSDNAYLISRGLTPDTLADPRFAGVIKQTSKGYPVFPMRDRDGFSGYETKTPTMPMMTRGEGGRSLWWSSGVSLASRIYLVESVVDAMSHAQMTGDREAGYIATGGQISAKQLALLDAALKRAHERGAAIVAAFDSDEMGERFTDMMRDLAKPQPGQIIERQTPKGKDWNDDLRAQAPLCRFPSPLSQGEERSDEGEAL